MLVIRCELPTEVHVDALRKVLLVLTGAVLPCSLQSRLSIIVLVSALSVVPSQQLGGVGSLPLAMLRTAIFLGDSLLDLVPARQQPRARMTDRAMPLQLNEQQQELQSCFRVLTDGLAVYQSPASTPCTRAGVLGSR